MNQTALKSAFGECTRAEVSKCRVASAYETTNLANFYVLDREGQEPVALLLEKGASQLEVKNGRGTSICLVKTDKCLFTDEHKKCDCILFNDAKIFLVEIKSGSLRTKSNKRRLAIVQLGDTVKLLQDKHLLPSPHDVRAVICFTGGQTRPIQPSLNSRRAYFLEDHHVSLEEGNMIEF